METIHKLSIGLIWIPTSILALKLIGSESKNFKIWIVFLMSGLMDVIGVFTPLTDNGDRWYYTIHLFYQYIQTILIVGLSSEFVDIKNKEKKMHWFYFLLTVIALLTISTLFTGSLKTYINNTSLFSAVIFIIYSFVSAIALLGLAEKNDKILQSPWFWFLSGIFFYSFGSFFIDMLMPTKIAGQVYFLRHIVNIIKCCFFTIGSIQFILYSSEYLKPKTSL
ncbi:hypothetical protein [Cognataquiflexum rubidum]|uniref:hypothetical protein n=1 Tax=Cognataquiflexum rubidum TaxID=2922273 RepID=UPI001F146D2C|nr:hypothetical protein [Cognataquiflexum rubidum]MCH6232473.1 hypothetical protein [Cognataquiflexum rubidum]